MATNREVVEREFLDELQQRADRSFKGRLHQAFVDWYVEAEFGDVEWKFTDDVNDGGIDAIVFLPDDDPKVAIIQSKFSVGLGKGKVSDAAYRDFKDVVNAFRYGDDDLEELLDHSRADLKRHYRKAFGLLEQSNSWFQRKKAFRLISTSQGRPAKQFSEIPNENFIYSESIFRLYLQFRQAETPKARDLQLHIDDKLKYSDRARGLTSYTFNAQLSDFRKYLEFNDPARLVARNIRYNLGSSIGKKIKSSYEKAPHDFWYFHNGLTIICDRFEESANTAKIIAPSVVNGAQTLYAISSSDKKSSPALVTVRVIERTRHSGKEIEDDEWLQQIIRSVNSQNRVREYDLRSNEPEQILLQNKFRDLRVYYERKRGEWREVRNEARFRGFDRLALTTLGQIECCVNDRNGNGVLVMKRGIDAVFEEKLYRELFPSRNRVARRFEKIYLEYRLYKLLYDYGYDSSETARRQRHGFWPSLWLLHLVFSPLIQHSHVTSASLKIAFDSVEATRASRAALRTLTSEVWNCWRKSNHRDPEQWTANNFFKVKFGMDKLRRAALPKIKPKLARVAKEVNFRAKS